MIDVILAFIKSIFDGNNKGKIPLFVIILLLLLIFGQPILKAVYVNSSEIEEQTNTLKILVETKSEVQNDPRLLKIWNKNLDNLDKSLDDTKYEIINLGNKNISTAISKKYIQILISLLIPVIVLIAGIVAHQKVLWLRLEV
jgi:hypothetical protein